MSTTNFFIVAFLNKKAYFIHITSFVDCSVRDAVPSTTEIYIIRLITQSQLLNFLHAKSLILSKFQYFAETKNLHLKINTNMYFIHNCTILLSDNRNCNIDPH